MQVNMIRVLTILLGLSHFHNHQLSGMMKTAVPVELHTPRAADTELGYMCIRIIHVRSTMRQNGTMHTE